MKSGKKTTRKPSISRKEGSEDDVCSRRLLRKEKLAWENAEKHGKKRLLKQKVSKGSIRESIGNRNRLEKVPRKEKLAWQNEVKCGKKGLQNLRVSEKSIRGCIL
jgi:hypothetical protein